jgi:hypothetical protein
MARLGDEFTTSVDDVPPELPTPEDDDDPPPHAVSAIAPNNVAAAAMRLLNLFIPTLRENYVIS